MGKDEGSWCTYNRMKGRHIEYFHQLKKEIKILIQRGKLLSYMKDLRGPAVKRSPPQRETNPGDPTNKKGKSVVQVCEYRVARHTLNTIVGGVTEGGDVSSTRKKYARAVMSVSQQVSPRMGDEKSLAISFSRRDVKHILAYANDTNGYKHTYSRLERQMSVNQSREFC